MCETHLKLRYPVDPGSYRECYAEKQKTDPRFTELSREHNSTFQVSYNTMYYVMVISDFRMAADAHWSILIMASQGQD